MLTTVKGRQKVTPLDYMRFAKALGPNVMLAPLCDTPSATVGRKRTLKSVERTLNFLDTSLASPDRVPTQPILGVVQGGAVAEFRERSAKETAKRDVDAFLLEGFGMGEQPSDVESLLSVALNNLPSDKLRVVHGQGSPEEVVRAIALGADMFETAYPVVLAEAGQALSLTFGSKS
jgi:tRNA-guanine family transglycosylase